MTVERGSVRRTKIVRIAGDGSRSEKLDRVAGEEPLEIRAAQTGAEPVSVAVTMRTPGHDFELAAGFLFTERLIEGDDIARVSYCDTGNRPLEPGPYADEFNVVTVRTRRPFDAGALRRNFFATSSCGVCGKAALEALGARGRVPAATSTVDRTVITALPDALRDAQSVFDRTGGLHAAGLFNAEGSVLRVREDVGRHNALDKVIGSFLLAGDGFPSDAILMVSGRTGFEIIQKSVVAGIQMICSVSAPSSLAVEMASEAGVTLAGFVRDGSFNVYSHPGRISG